MSKFIAGKITFHVVPYGYEAEVEFTVENENGEIETHTEGGARDFSTEEVGIDFFNNLLTLYELGEKVRVTS